MPFPNLQSSFGYSADPKGSQQGAVCLGTVTNKRPFEELAWTDGVPNFNRFLLVYTNLQPQDNQSMVVQFSTNAISSNESWVVDNYYNTDGVGGTSDVTGGLMLVRFNPYGTSGYAIINYDPDNPGQGNTSFRRLITIQAFTSTQFADVPGQSITAGQRNFNEPITRLRIFCGNINFTGTATLYGLT